MPTIREIQSAVALHYDVRVVDMTSARQTNSVLWPRHVAMWLARPHYSLRQIGRAFQRDHSSVFYAINKVSRCIAQNAAAGADISGIVA